MLFGIYPAIAQTRSIPIEKLIPGVKKTALPVICLDRTQHGVETSQGTAVLVGYKNRYLFLTCEHILAVKDSLNKTISYLSEIYVIVNNVDGSITPLRTTIKYVDEQLDFALLSIAPDEKNKEVIKSQISSLHMMYIQPRLWEKSEDLKEGETTLYIGYPLAMGIGEHNYPLIRTGIISQLVYGRPYFLIDGFIQHGHSGSPVFVFRYTYVEDESGDKKYDIWNREPHLAGITTSFPPEFGEVYQEVSFEREKKRKTLINPGFSAVTSMDHIIPILNKVFGIKTD